MMMMMMMMHRGRQPYPTGRRLQDMNAASLVVSVVLLMMMGPTMASSSSSSSSTPLLFPTWTPTLPNTQALPLTDLHQLFVQAQIVDLAEVASIDEKKKKKSKKKAAETASMVPDLIILACEQAERVLSVDQKNNNNNNNNQEDDIISETILVKKEKAATSLQLPPRHVVQALLSSATNTTNKPSTPLLWQYGDTNATTATTTTCLVVSTPNATTTAATARTMGAALATAISTSATDPKQQAQQKSVTVWLGPSALQQNDSSLMTNDDIWTEFFYAFYNGFYKDIRFKGGSSKEGGGDDKETSSPPVSVTFVVNSNDVFDDDDDEMDDGTEHNHDLEDALDASSLEAALHRASILAHATAMARDVVNAPHNVLNSISLAATARAVAQQYPRVLTCRILSEQDCATMGAFLGVARASETPPQFIHVTYRAPPSLSSSSSSSSIFSSFWGWSRSQTAPPRVLGVIGKGLLFDTGGYNLKTGGSMTNMKFDCGGAAAVLGAARAIAALEPPGVEVHFLIAATENMVNERGVVPGDILVASNGKTIEVLNTDAEGRLTMADALVYADKTLKCSEILELSTLTGACMSALGTAMAGLFTHDSTMAETLQSIGEACGNKVWRMPMAAEYEEEIVSKLADLKNIGGRFGGAITAALFLQHFCQDASFAHVDMAGPVWDYKASQASGWGARLVTGWVLNHSSRHVSLA